MDDLGAQLAQRGYRPAGMVAKVGDFARRGGLLDIFTPGDDPLRVEFFDDEIVSIRRFDVETQRTTERGDEARDPAGQPPAAGRRRGPGLPGPGRGACWPPAERRATRISWTTWRRAWRTAWPTTGWSPSCPGSGPTATLADYLPEGTPVFWLDPVRLQEQSDLLDGELPRLRDGRLDTDPVLPAVDELVEPARATGPARA